VGTGGARDESRVKDELETDFLAKIFLFFIINASETFIYCRVSDPYSFFPDPDPEVEAGDQYGSGSNPDPKVEAGDQYGSGSGSNPDPGL
jgi:hypothetical protein